MMQLKQLQQGGDTSSGYGSRESLADVSPSPMKVLDEANIVNNELCCSRRRSRSRKCSSSKAMSINRASDYSDLDNSYKLLQGRSLNSSSEGKSLKKTRVNKSFHSSHSSGLGSNMNNSRILKHTYSSLGPAVDNEMETCSKNSHKTSVSSQSRSHHLRDGDSHCLQNVTSSDIRPVLDYETLSNSYEDLVVKNQQLVEENQRLREDLSVFLRFFQGTLNDLNYQMTTGESKVTILQETYSTFGETVEDLKTRTAQNTKGEQSDSDKTDESCRTTKHDRRSDSEMEKSEMKVTKLPEVSGVRKYVKKNKAISCDISPSSKSSDLDANSKRRSSWLQRRDITEMKENLLARNKNLKTDIESLKTQSKRKEMCMQAESTDFPVAVVHDYKAPDILRTTEETPILNVTNKNLDTDIETQKMHGKHKQICKETESSVLSIAIVKDHEASDVVQATEEITSHSSNLELSKREEIVRKVNVEESPLGNDESFEVADGLRKDHGSYIQNQLQRNSSLILDEHIEKLSKEFRSAISVY